MKSLIYYENIIDLGKNTNNKYEYNNWFYIL